MIRSMYATAALLVLRPAGLADPPPVPGPLLASYRLGPGVTSGPADPLDEPVHSFRAADTPVAAAFL